MAQDKTTLATDKEKVSYAIGLDVARSFQPIAQDVDFGAMQRALDMTVAYSKERVQFGRPIGSFQALKHRMAEMFALVETARSASYAATDSLAAADAAVAKVYCSEAFSHVAAESIQMHGGIAITWEHDAQLYFKRAHGSSQLFGSPATYVRRFAQSA